MFIIMISLYKFVLLVLITLNTLGERFESSCLPLQSALLEGTQWYKKVNTNTYKWQLVCNREFFLAALTMLDDLACYLERIACINLGKEARMRSYLAWRIPFAHVQKHTRFILIPNEQCESIIFSGAAYPCTAVSTPPSITVAGRGWDRTGTHSSEQIFSAFFPEPKSRNTKYNGGKACWEFANFVVRKTAPGLLGSSDLECYDPRWCSAWALTQINSSYGRDGHQPLRGVSIGFPRGAIAIPN